MYMGGHSQVPKTQTEVANYNVQNMFCKLEQVLKIPMSVSLRIASQVQSANTSSKVPTHRKFKTPYASHVQNANRSCNIQCATYNVQHMDCKLEQGDNVLHATPQMFLTCDSATVSPTVSPTGLLPVRQIANWAMQIEVLPVALSTKLQLKCCL